MLNRTSTHATLLGRCCLLSVPASASASSAGTVLLTRQMQVLANLHSTTATTISAHASHSTSAHHSRSFSTAAAVDSSLEDNDSAAMSASATATLPEHALDNFKISEVRKEILRKLSINSLFEIQAKTYSIVTEGKDLIARAQTGSGKTLGFALPIVERLSETKRTKHPRCLVMAPTRELAKQVARAFAEIAPELRITCVYGGAPYGSQASDLRKGVDVLVATPGRLMDLMERGDVSLADITHVVLDEADEMLRVGFKEQVDEILSSAPKDRQTILFSATLPPWVQNICNTQLRNPIKVDLVGSRKSKVVSDVKHLAIEVSGGQEGKDQLLADLVAFYSQSRCIVFTATKRQADMLVNKGVFRTETQVLHGDIAQTSREMTLDGFRNGVFRVLVATDVAARGLDIPEIDLVIQYDVPNDTEGYIHRSGRTGRAGRSGTAIVMYYPKEKREVMDLARNIGRDFEYIQPPAPQTVAEQKANESIDIIKNVPADTVAVFQAVARQMTQESDPHDVLAAALAVLAGYKDGIIKRSLITSEASMQTMHMTGNFYTKGRALQKLFADCPEISGRIGAMKKTSDGVVFDVPCKFVESVSKVIGVEPVLTLPPLLEFAGERVDMGSSSISRGGDRGRGGERGGFRDGGRVREDAYGRDRNRSSRDGGDRGHAGGRGDDSRSGSARRSKW
eukprot:c17741_g1_i1.p1 GENE.c17741_g1_i1~~c17741_g1_i1.p1  ORF type:complete len:710 (+),score=183.07 c17741_g1_i1:88-2130(+)